MTRTLATWPFADVRGSWRLPRRAHPVRTRVVAATDKAMGAGSYSILPAALHQGAFNGNCVQLDAAERLGAAKTTAAEVEYSEATQSPGTPTCVTFYGS